MVVITQNKKANEFSPTPHYFHEMSVMMTLFATFLLLMLFWLVNYLSLYLRVSCILFVQHYGKRPKINVRISLHSFLNCKEAVEDRVNQRCQERFTVHCTRLWGVITRSYCPSLTTVLCTDSDVFEGERDLFTLSERRNEIANVCKK